MTYQQGPGGYGSPYDPRQVDPYAQGTPYPPAQYGAPVYGYAYPPKPPTNTMAVLSLVFALCGFVIWFICSLLGLIFGIVAKKQLKQSGEGGDGLATAGIVISAILLGLKVVGLLIWLLFILIWGAVAVGAS
ncbi:MAG: DUF4190 domain-containing protein [Streptosporangiales bacterium]